MNDRNFEDIDKLFREGLNPREEPITFQQNDWAKLKDRLERNEKRKRGFFWISRLSGVAALILLFFAIRMLMPESQKQVIQQAEVQQKDKIVQKEQNKSIASAEANKEISKANPDTNKRLSQNKYLEVKTPKKRLIASVLRNETAGIDTVGVENSRVKKETTEPTVNSKELNSTKEKNISNEHNPTQPDIVKAPDRKLSTKDEPLFADIVEPNENPTPERSFRKLALSVMAAPDYNGVNNLNNASMGDDFGLMVSYEIAKNWSLSTGGVYAKKLYETGFGNYYPSKNIWTVNYPNSVSADCRVLDIPLNISYTFLRRKNKTISVGSGISSYIMLKENYSFTYTKNDPNNPLSYQLINQNQHWLSVLNLQASFEQRINSRISMSIQPYWKVPLRDIGFAGVKLQSFGTAVNLIYNFDL